MGSLLIKDSTVCTPRTTPSGILVGAYRPGNHRSSTGVKHRCCQPPGLLSNILVCSCCLSVSILCLEVSKVYVLVLRTVLDTRRDSSPSCLLWVSGSNRALSCTHTARLLGASGFSTTAHQSTLPILEVAQSLGAFRFVCDRLS